MKKVFLLYKPRLTNGQHFAFITAFTQEIQAVSGAPAKLQATFDTMVEAQKVEDKYLKMAQGSELTGKIREADTLRDESYRKLRDIVKVWAGSGTEPQAAAATALQRVIKTYKINASAQMDEESGLMANLITDLSTADMQANIKAIGAEKLLDGMKQGNGQVITLLKQRDEADSAKVVGALRKARIESDKAYTDATEAIEAFNYVQGGYDSLIDRWNATVNRYQEMLNRKTGSTKHNPSDGDGGNTGGSDSGNTGGDNTGGGNTGGGNTGGGNTGGGSTGGGSTGGDSGDDLS